MAVKEEPDWTARAEPGLYDVAWDPPGICPALPVKQVGPSEPQCTHLLLGVRR